MIEFKKNVKNILPYDRRQYIRRLKDDDRSHSDWFGVTFQLPGAREGKDIGLRAFVKHYGPLFKKTIHKLDNGAYWIANHDDKDWEWFPTDQNNSVSLRNLFKQNHIANSFKGAITFTTDDVLKFSKALITYPYTVINKRKTVYSNLDISHGELPFIIKTDAHWGIDFLSTNKDLLREVVDENSSEPFLIRQYRGAALW